MSDPDEEICLIVGLGLSVWLFDYTGGQLRPAKTCPPGLHEEVR
jgi:hypothetical protein